MTPLRLTAASTRGFSDAALAVRIFHARAEADANKLRELAPPPPKTERVARGPSKSPAGQRASHQWAWVDLSCGLTKVSWTPLRGAARPSLLSAATRLRVSCGLTEVARTPLRGAGRPSLPSAADRGSRRTTESPEWSREVGSGQNERTRPAFCDRTGSWAWVDLNYRPHAYQDTVRFTVSFDTLRKSGILGSQPSVRFDWIRWDSAPILAPPAELVGGPGPTGPHPLEA